MLHLTESDLRFLVETVATSRRDYDHIVDLVRDKEDLLEIMLEDPKLTERILREEEALVRISPHLLFTLLLRRLRKELDKEAYFPRICSAFCSTSKHHIPSQAHAKRLRADRETVLQRRSAGN